MERRAEYGIVAPTSGVHEHLSEGSVVGRMVANTNGYTWNVGNAWPQAIEWLQFYLRIASKAYPRVKMGHRNCVDALLKDVDGMDCM